MKSIRFNLYLPRDDYNRLKALQRLTGKLSMAETIRHAIALQSATLGKTVILRDRKTGEEERLIFV